MDLKRGYNFEIYFLKKAEGEKLRLAILIARPEGGAFLYTQKELSRTLRKHGKRLKAETRATLQQALEELKAAAKAGKKFRLWNRALHDRRAPATEGAATSRGAFCDDPIKFFMHGLRAGGAETKARLRRTDGPMPPARGCPTSLFLARAPRHRIS
ncbi:MAG: hypothetical protein PHY92_02635 [Alphaproteobacteria bacterium]|nr:hypothetical protein [Alphaproteobacteria bacterium]